MFILAARAVTVPLPDTLAPDLAFAVAVGLLAVVTIAVGAMVVHDLWRAPRTRWVWPMPATAGCVAASIALAFSAVWLDDAAADAWATRAAQVSAETWEITWTQEVRASGTDPNELAATGVALVDGEATECKVTTNTDAELYLSCRGRTPPRR